MEIQTHKNLNQAGRKQRGDRWRSTIRLASRQTKLVASKQASRKAGRQAQSCTGTVRERIDSWWVVGQTLQEYEAHQLTAIIKI